ncbi:hypothetical protein [Hymenobacter sp. UYP22]|uniref:hypothetical protein n=1 Tax=Hymenobacter sp. UYP22 TaxID=3156348 RepID=UPI0033954B85
MKRLVSAALLLFLLPACELIFGDACSSGPAYYDVSGVLLSVNRYSYHPQYRSIGVYLQVSERYYSRRTGSSGTAYACSPTNPGYRGTKERLDSLVFTSRYDYDVQHPAGTPLNDILRKQIGTSDSLVAMKSGGIEPPRSLNLRLSVPPTRTGIQQFVVRYRQTNGEIYTAVTDTVKVYR